MSRYAYTVGCSVIEADGKPCGLPAENEGTVAYPYLCRGHANVALVVGGCGRPLPKMPDGLREIARATTEIVYVRAATEGE